MAAVVCGLSLSFTACSDDDVDDSVPDGSTIEGDPYQKTSDTASDLFRIVNQLADVDSLPNDWKTAEFEPTEGKVLDTSQPLVRSEAVMNMTEARDLFRALIGENFDESKSTVVWKNDDLGSLTYTELGQSDCLATVDVRIKQMPHLQQLRFVLVSALGDNAMKYTPYYRIGDVVQDKDGAYWICVRAAGGPKNKDKTHWISMQVLQENSKVSGFKSNILRKADNLIVPQNLGGTETEHLKYFAQLMYLLQRPAEYGQNMGPGQAMEAGLGALGTNLGKNARERDETAYSQEDLNAIANLWNTLDVWKKVLPKGVSKEFFLKDEVKMLYNGHSNAVFGSDISLFLCTQSGTCRSIQTLSKPTWSKNDQTKTFNVTEYAINGKPTNSNILGNDSAIVVRMCTGKELADNTLFQPNYYDRIKNVENLVVTRFRLNSYCPYFRIGDVFKDEEGSRWFVINSAGYGTDDLSFLNSPYSYLVSFDNVRASADKKYATNIPKRDLATKVMFYMYMLCTFDMYERTLPDRWDTYSDPNGHPSKQVQHSIYTNTGVDLCYLFDVIQSPKGIRQAFINTTFAYDDGSQGQKLLRFLHDTQQEGNSFRVSIWSRYPLVYDYNSYPDPGDRTMFYLKDQGTGAIHENIRIMLTDISDQSMISKYADDYFVKQPFNLREENKGPREKRTQADSRAKDVTNFFYDREKMNNRTLPLSMWNEPVLFFRATKVFDHGEDHEMTTIDGHKLKALYKYPYTSDVEDDNYYTGVAVFTINSKIAYEDVFQDGVRTPLKTWLYDGE